MPFNNSRPLKILMVTNTYQNIVGGLEKSIQTFSKQFREWGHQVLIAGPDFVGEELGNAPEKRKRTRKTKGPEPALQNQDTETLFSLPFAHRLTKKIDRFCPDVIHAHHPFLMGEMGLRFSARYDRPVLFTYHILFNQYAHYLGGGNPKAARFLVELAAGYCNNVTRLIAPSESIREILRQEGVRKPIDVVPTGVSIQEYSKGDREGVRKKMGLSEKNILVGHIGRISAEKNMEFLIRAVAGTLKQKENAHFLLAGKGPLMEKMKTILNDRDIAERVHLSDALQGQDLVDHYHALDLFAFASKSETQGMVLIEAMAAGVPVVGVDAPGVRETIQDRENGRLVKEETFADALAWSIDEAADTKKWNAWKEKSRETAAHFSVERCAERELKTYQAAIEDYAEIREKSRMIRRVKVELDILYNFSRAGLLALFGAALK